MRGEGRRVQSGTLVALALAGLVILSGCQAFVGPDSSSSTPEMSPTETPERTVDRATSSQPTPTPAVSERRRAELERFMDRVDRNTPKTGEWQIVDAETVRYRTTPDFDVRDEYGVGSDPPPEAIARAMATVEDNGPDEVIVEIVSDEGEFLGRFNVSEDIANAFVDYRLLPSKFTNISGRTGNYTSGYFSQGEAAIYSIYIDQVELRRAYLAETLERLRRNATDFDENVVDWGLYNETYRIPDRDVWIKRNSTVYISLKFAKNKSSDTLGEITNVWSKLHEERYYDQNAAVTIQPRLYYVNNSFKEAWHITSRLAHQYGADNITFYEYIRTLSDYIVDTPESLPGVDREL